jgi:hypothetical protein
MTQDALTQVRRIALALPQVTERPSAGAPCFFVRDKKPICRFHDADFGGDDRIAIWCPAPPGARDELVTSEPDRFFAPTPSASGVFGDWIGVYLDTEGELAVDWQEIAAIIEQAFRLRAPKSLIADLD